MHVKHPIKKPTEKRQRVKAEGSVSSKTRSIQPENLSGNPSYLNDRSAIDTLYQQGSARIRFPNQTQGPLQAVLINTAGGLTGNDDIHWRAVANKHSHLCISTAACEKIYRTHGPSARQNTTLHVAENARLEWLPQESIVFNGANLHRTLELRMQDSSEALVVESLIFGRLAMNERCDNAIVRDRWRIYRNNQLLHAEDLHINMNTNANIRSQSQMHHYGATSTVVLIADKTPEWFANIASRVRALLPLETTQTRVGVSVLPSRLVIRFVAKDSFQLRKILIPCIEILNDGRLLPTVWKV